MIVDCMEGNYNRKDNYVFFFVFNYELFVNIWLENFVWFFISVVWKNDLQMSDCLFCQGFKIYNVNVVF